MLYRSEKWIKSKYFRKLCHFKRLGREYTPPTRFWIQFTATTDVCMSIKYNIFQSQSLKLSVKLQKSQIFWLVLRIENWIRPPGKMKDRIKGQPCCTRPQRIYKQWWSSFLQSEINNHGFQMFRFLLLRFELCGR